MCPNWPETEPERTFPMIDGVRYASRAIGAHPGVRDVVCVGRPSERWGQEVVALVAVSGEGVTEVEL